MNTYSRHFKAALAMCLCAALWFAVGGVIKLLLAHSQGKAIEMVVCSGAGMKKIYVQVPSSGTHAETSTEVAVKHCSNTPLALAPSDWEMPRDLAYVPPNSRNAIGLSDIAPNDRHSLLNSRPPPGRAPPLLPSVAA